MADEEFEVEKIVAHKLSKKGKVKQKRKREAYYMEH